jgi:5-hydroxytryptamine receptor 1
MCRLWFSCDVLFSTAYIIHLACISLDRYLSIVRPFEHERTSSERRRYVMIFFCWFLSALLSFIPIFTGLYTTREQKRKIDCLSHAHGRCIFAVNQAYAIVSSSFSFWVPGAIMIIMYAMLIRIADKKEREAYAITDAVIQRRRASQINPYLNRRLSSDDQTNAELTPMTQKKQRNSQVLKPIAANGHSNNLRRQGKHDSLDTQIDRQSSVDLPGGVFDHRNSHMKHLKRERRAVKTLGSVMVAFVICWLPFFVRYTACEPDRCDWKIGPLIADIVFWVGYFNSMINP